MSTTTPAAAGETNLREILRSLNPVLHPGEFVFCTLPEVPDLSAGEMVLMFHEKEGVTVVVPRASADRMQWQYSFVAAWITLQVHSSLSAVGLTAAFATALSQAGISCNTVAAFYHDHLFVPNEDAHRALQVLRELSR